MYFFWKPTINWDFRGLETGESQLLDLILRIIDMMFYARDFTISVPLFLIFGFAPHSTEYFSFSLSPYVVCAVLVLSPSNPTIFLINGRSNVEGILKQRDTWISLVSELSKLRTSLGLPKCRFCEDRWLWFLRVSFCYQTRLTYQVCYPCSVFDVFVILIYNFQLFRSLIILLSFFPCFINFYQQFSPNFSTENYRLSEI